LDPLLRSSCLEWGLLRDWPFGDGPAADPALAVLWTCRGLRVGGTLFREYCWSLALILRKEQLT